MSHKVLFRRFLAADPDRLHFAAHSHHPWPDVTYQAQIRAWEDAAGLMDDKWDMIFGVLVPETRVHLSSLLGLPDPVTIVFAPNTHELVVRVFSCLQTPVRIVTTDSEFHSFDRQLQRWEEAGLAGVTRVATEPFATFAERVWAVAPEADLLYLSQVMFDSGFVVTDLPRIVTSARSGAFVVVDGYHGFMALPTDLSGMAERVFYLAGGYKYAMAGEGVCFMHCPPGFGDRPVDTGWFAGFQALSDRTTRVDFGDGGDRFWGATFDPSGLYRLRAVLKLLDEEGLSPAVIHRYVEELQDRFLADAAPGELLPPRGFERANFLTFRTADAGSIYRHLHRQGVIVDHRGDRLRIGFGIYHDPEDVDRLVKAVNSFARR